ncbi:3-deoxy-7-phosphoheptulonate synthase [Bifidobacterium pseudolongum]|uniref:3-deoxy-7-phosphoheptulonate synthase n=1 Tax=Bifidobacterium pseudolongum TaxID=1694 RepID=UPI000BA8D74F|nr:3-deoxy-7-phosphoheptulonate synthase [Bifidobacterium pseudolongum]ASW23733.1 3-deoxy-7-phosphoheptulonate synthase [Bifidobacterium pseudolongum]RYQ08227.1 phospho-2-dehydro-3-deoxyheptonate aldolase [Bifidobacterium pseudolongum subsp. globosum]
MAHDPHTPQFEDHTRAIAQGRPLTYTPEQLHAVHQIVAEGGNPLTDMHDLPRWEDEVGIDRIINRRVMELDPLPTPAQVLTELPLDARARHLVASSRDEIRACLYGQDDRLLVLVGPCSVHDPAAALDYARRLEHVRRELENELLIVMRVYFEKPRSTVGWKGLINDPDIDGSHNIQKGLLLARKTLLDVLGAGLAAATEFLEPTSPQYIADAVSWGAIGARNTESQVHRQLASGLSMPIGFKNATDGSVKAAVNGCFAAAQQHTFFGIDHMGRACAVETIGNPDCHVVLRGSSSGPNYDADSVAQAMEAVRAQMPADSAAAHGLIIDCSHGNSGKDDVRQTHVVREIAERVAQGEPGITGIMMESFLEGGNQPAAPLNQLVYGKSITDKCLSWPVTEQLLHELAEAVRTRRWN